MADGQIVHKKVSGLRTARNKFLVPEGSLLVAQNATIDMSDVISTRRGFSRHGAQQSAAFARLFEFRKTMIGVTGQTIKYYDSVLGWTAWTGSYTPPSGEPIRGVEVDEKFYFTTDNGPFVQDTLTGTPRRAGIPRALDVQASANSSATGWMPANTKVGYRLVWGKESLPPGSPSEFAIVTNSGVSKIFVNLDIASSTPRIQVSYSSHGLTTGDAVVISQNGSFGIVPGTYIVEVIDQDNFVFTNTTLAAIIGTVLVSTTKDTTITSTIPSGVEAGWWFEVYRSSATVDLDSDPFDDCQAVTKQFVTSTDISNGYVTWIDTVDDAFRGVQLYTNDGTAEGFDATNDRPPFARFIAHFRGHVFYFGVRREHEAEIQLQTTDGITDEVGAVTITAGGTPVSYTFSASEVIASRKFQRFTESGEGSMAQAVRKTAQSLAKVVNRDATSPVYCYYQSGPNDEPGKILFRRRDLFDISFSVTANSSVPSGAFSPSLPASGTAVASSNEAFANRVDRSKSQKPEAVPTLNNMGIGRHGFSTLGVVVLKDSMLVAREDGVFEVTGETDGFMGRNFVVRELDPTLVLVAPETFVALDNAAFGWFNQGVCRVSSGGSAIISDDIYDLLTGVKRFQNFPTRVFAIPNDSDQKYILFVPEDGSASYSTLGYVFDYLENSWMGPWRKDVTCGLVSNEEDVIYLSHALDFYALRERKDYQDYDFVDEEFSVSVTANGTTTLNGVTVSTADVTYTYSETLAEGWLFRQGVNRANVEVVTPLGGTSYRLALSRQFTITNTTADLGIPIEVLIHWADDPAENVGKVHDFVEAQIYMDGPSARHHYIGFSSDVIGAETMLPRIDQSASTGWGDEWGGIWGNPVSNFSTPIRAPVPRQHRRARALRTVYRNKWARERVDILQLSLVVNDISEMTTLAPRT